MLNTEKITLEEIRDKYINSKQPFGTLYEPYTNLQHQDLLPLLNNKNITLPSISAEECDLIDPMINSYTIAEKPNGDLFKRLEKSPGDLIRYKRQFGGHAYFNESQFIDKYRAELPDIFFLNKNYELNFNIEIIGEIKITQTIHVRNGLIVDFLDNAGIKDFSELDNFKARVIVWKHLDDFNYVAPVVIKKICAIVGFVKK